MADKPHLSASALGTLSRCAEQYRRRYIEAHKIAPGWAMHAGTGTHAAVEADLRARIETGALLPAEAIPDLARDGTRRSMEQSGLALDAEGQMRGIEAVRGAAVDRAIRLARLHHAEVAPALHPAALEAAWRVEIPGASHDLIGYIDVVERDGTVRDTKTSGRSPAKDAADASLQLTIYALGQLVTTGSLPPAVALDVLVDKKKPEPVTLTSTRDRDDMARLLARLERAMAVIASGAYMPTDNPMVCNARSCGYYATCPVRIGARPVSVSMPSDDGEEV